MTCIGDGAGIAAAIVVALFIGFALGVLCSLAFWKFVQWMRGKSLYFNPWPRVRVARIGHDPVMDNPTYELERSPRKEPTQERRRAHSTRMIDESSSLSKILEKPNTEVYEEPVNDMEKNFDEPGELLPYAVHDFNEEVQVKVEPKPWDGKPTRDRKPMRDGPRPVVFKKSKGSAKISSQEVNPAKMQQVVGIKKKPPIPGKLMKPSMDGSAQLDCDPMGAYSELDKKTSYATLEPHIGDSIHKVETEMQESYRHLNH